MLSESSDLPMWAPSQDKPEAESESSSLNKDENDARSPSQKKHLSEVLLARFAVEKKKTESC